MSRWRGTFADRIIRGPIIVAPWLSDVAASLTDLVAAAVAEIERTQLFVVDNVAEYLYAGTAQERWGPADFPCIAPPFESFFIEWGRPTRVISEEFGEVDTFETTPAHTGWLFTASERPDGNDGWLLRGTLFTDVDGRDPMHKVVGYPQGVMWTALIGDFLVEPDGRLLEMPEPKMFYGQLPDEKLRTLGGIAAALSVHSFPALLALSFVNCINVPRERVEPPAKLVRSDRRRGRTPRLSYHLLDIGPMQRILAHDMGGGGVQQALHVRRGHFKTYNADAPLFGRHAGTWWWGPRIRGSSDAGVVMKDYRVQGPS